MFLYKFTEVHENGDRDHTLPKRNNPRSKTRMSLRHRVKKKMGVARGDDIDVNQDTTSMK